MASGPTPRVNWSLQVNPLNSEMVIFGGEHFDGKLTRFFNDLYRVDIKKDGSLSWKRYSSPNSPINTLSAV
ncbi:MAG: hypothetical protein EBX46_03725 [Burkholderiaceae bacterium]|nr:hypothetical protein [Burkholderiaceae bacterium]